MRLWFSWRTRSRKSAGRAKNSHHTHATAHLCHPISYLSSTLDLWVFIFIFLRLLLFFLFLIANIGRCALLQPRVWWYLCSPRLFPIFFSGCSQSILGVS